MPHRFKAFHRPFALSDGLMRVLGAIVEIPRLPVGHRPHELAGHCHVGECRRPAEGASLPASFRRVGYRSTFQFGPAAALPMLARLVVGRRCPRRRTDQGLRVVA